MHQLAQSSDTHIHTDLALFDDPLDSIGNHLGVVFQAAIHNTETIKRLQELSNTHVPLNRYLVCCVKCGVLVTTRL